jgi:hypothetical protein
VRTTDLNHLPAWHQTRVFVLWHAPTYRRGPGADGVARYEDGDWTCCSCGPPLTPSLTGLRTFRSATRDLELRAA